MHSTGSIAAASRQIAAGSMDLHDRTEKQAAALEQTAASVEQITATAKQSADHVREVSALAGQSAQLARQGSEETSTPSTPCARFRKARSASTRSSA